MVPTRKPHKTYGNTQNILASPIFVLNFCLIKFKIHEIVLKEKYLNSKKKKKKIKLSEIWIEYKIKFELNLNSVTLNHYI